MRYSLLTNIWILTTLISGCFNLSYSQNHIISDFSYLSPQPFSNYITSRQAITFRFSTTISNFELNEVQVFVKGNKSGELPGNFKLSTDHKTFIYRTYDPFVSNETIEVTIISSAYISGGSFHFQFSIGNLNNNKREQIAKEVMKKRLSEVNQINVFPAKKSGSAIQDDLPEGFPELEVTYQNNPSPGYIFIAPYSNATGALFNIIIDNNGTPIYYKKSTSGTADFKVQPSGDITYFDIPSSKYYRMNSLYDIVDTIRVSNGYYSDMHELRMLENGNYLLMGIDPQLVNMDTVVPGGHPQAVVVGLIIQELNTSEEVVFQWRSWDHFQITDATDYVNMSDSLIDYVHGNSIEIVSDTNLLLSCRNMNEITNINRNTGEIIWRLGGKNNMFDMINFPDTFCMQHSIRLMPDSANLSLFDNGNCHLPEPYSSAVEYQLNESEMEIEMVNQIRNDPDIFGVFMGHAQRLQNGNTIVGWGYGVPSVSEFDAENNKLLEISFPYANYRAFKFDWETTVFETNVNEINFGNIDLQDSIMQTIEISNNCNYPIEINRFLTQNNVYTPVENLPVIIAANEMETIAIKFKADEPGAYNDILTLCWDVESEDLVQRIARQVTLSGSAGNQGLAGSVGNKDLLIFPNPFKEEFYLQITDRTIDRITIYDHTGVVVKKTGNIYSKNAYIQLKGHNGIYFIEVKLKNGQKYTTKILKQ